MLDSTTRTTTILCFLIVLLAAAAGAESGDSATPECLTPEAAGPLTKQMLSLAFTAYLDETFVHSDQTLHRQLKPCFDVALETLPELHGGWTRVWGPYVSKFKDVIFTDNLLFAVTSQDGSTRRLAIVIRGTNYVSLSDWLVEDFEIHKMVEWNPKSPESLEQCAAIVPTRKTMNHKPPIPMIAEGTCKGLRALLELGPPDQPPILGFVETWLNDNDKGGQKSEIYVTGHSLGGTLTPVLAQYLSEKLGKDVDIKTYSFAGLTPGNNTFATLVEGQLGLPNIHRIHNPLDVAPYWWEQKFKEKVSRLYLPRITRTFGEGLLFQYWSDQVNEYHNYAQVNQDFPPLCKTTMPTGRRTRTFLHQAFWQHHYGYLYGLDMLTQDDDVCKPCAASMAKNFCNPEGQKSDDLSGD